MKHKITSADIEIAVANYYGIRNHVILYNASWGLGFMYELDMLVFSKSRYATEIEIKVSKSDILKDLTKRFQHSDSRIKHVFFAVPESLVEFCKEKINPDFGVLSVKELERYPGTFKITQVRGAKQNSRAEPWPDKTYIKALELANLRLHRAKRDLLAAKRELKSLKSIEQ